MTVDTILYDRLGVASDSSDSVIKKAFNDLAKVWHPDKITDEEKKKTATVKFQEMTQAKEILLDKEKRSLYDRVGIEILKNNGEGGQENPFSSFFGQQQKQEDIHHKVNVTLEDVYNSCNIIVNYQQKICIVAIQSIR